VLNREILTFILKSFPEIHILDDLNLQDAAVWHRCQEVGFDPIPVWVSWAEDVDLQVIAVQELSDGFNPVVWELHPK